jgi:hypothetical protein
MKIFISHIRQSVGKKAGNTAKEIEKISAIAGFDDSFAFPPPPPTSSVSSYKSLKNPHFAGFFLHFVAVFVQVPPATANNFLGRIMGNTFS